MIIHQIIKILIIVLNHEMIKVISDYDNKMNLIKKYFIRKLSLKVCVLKNINLIISNNKLL